MKHANKEAYDAVQDMQRGLHFAMNELIVQKDYRRTEEILRQVDALMVDWINSTRKVQ